MADRVRVGVVGTSWWADLVHLPSIKSHPHATIAAICGRSRDRAEEMAKKYAIPAVFTDYRDMIARGNLHAVVISTPDDLHYPITMDALDAGLHVLCEKPLALNAAQARAMYERAESAGVKHMVFFTWRWMPHFQHFHKLIEAGYIGRCFDCHLRFIGGYGRDGQYGWRFDRQRANGILGDLGAHMVDLGRWFVGDVDRVSAHLSACITRPGAGNQPLDPANDSALVLIEFVNGAQGVIEVSAVAHVGARGMDQGVVLHGASGTLEADVFFGTGVEIRGAQHDEQEIGLLAVPDQLWEGVDRTRPFDAQMIDLFCQQPIGDRLFIDAILEDRPVSPSFYDGWKAQQVIDAAIESHRSGARISIIGG